MKEQFFLLHDTSADRHFAETKARIDDIAYVENSILSVQAFITLMATAFCLNISVPATIAWWKPYCAGKKELPGKQPQRP